MGLGGPHFGAESLLFRAPPGISGRLEELSDPLLRPEVGMKQQLHHVLHCGHIRGNCRGKGGFWVQGLGVFGFKGTGSGLGPR